jgi:hypothetical protein
MQEPPNTKATMPMDAKTYFTGVRLLVVGLHSDAGDMQLIDLVN